MKTTAKYLILKGKYQIVPQTHKEKNFLEKLRNQLTTEVAKLTPKNKQNHIEENSHVKLSRYLRSSY